jgi:tetratricopeptide (TPR) repeat protein
LFLGGIALLLWGGWGFAQRRQSRRELDEAKQDIEAKRYATARQRLLRLTRSPFFRDEVLYQLGVCEEARGRTDSALSAWEEVPSSSPFSLKSTIARARVLANSGRFSDADALLDSVPWRRDSDSKQVRQVIELLLRLEGRRDEILPLILETWDGSPDPAAVLHRIYLLDNSAFPVDYVRNTLMSADPNDDRVCLGKANLATWTGKFAEAARWLRRCLDHQPDDPAVWRAGLDLALASDDLDGLRRAVAHLPAARLAPGDVLRVRAWIAAHQGNRDLERRTLLALLDEEPGNIAAWDRLAELAVMEGHHQEAANLRRKKAEMNSLRERYKTLISGDNRALLAEELERLARRLGRRLEARGWSLIRQGLAAKTPLLPDQDQEVPRKPHPTAETLVADLLPRTGEATARTRPDRHIAAASFTDDAEPAGLRFVHDNGHSGRRNPPPPEAMCGGVALLDYDRDGWLDVYVVQGGPFPPGGTTTSSPGDDREQDARITPGDRLFRNRGDGSFENATERSGIASLARGYGHGVAVADYDNDGYPDLFVTRWRSYALYRNKGDRTFEDVTRQVGLDGDRDWPTSAAFADLDGDGDLDLYVCHYLRYDPNNPKRCEHPDSPNSHECNPLDFPSLPDHVFRNDAGRFVEVTAEAGFVDPDGRGLGVVAADLDGDGRIDLYVANDMTANYLFRNLGGFRFEEVGQLSGAAASADGGFKAGMGIACGDLDGDGQPDLAVTNFFGESTTFYRNLGRGSFADHSTVIGLAAPTRRLLGFGIAFVDVDNDGWLDLLSANGHILDGRPRFPWMMPLQLLLGGPGGRLTDVSETAGAPFRPLHLGRGLAIGDVDNDGRLEAVVVAQNEPLIYLHNMTSTDAHFIHFRLEGTKSNRDAIGARITLSCAGRTLVEQRIGGSSYQSSNDPRIHFGLGACRRVDCIEVRWPSGRTDRHTDLPADREYLIREGSASVAPGILSHRDP